MKTAAYLSLSILLTLAACGESHEDADTGAGADGAVDSGGGGTDGGVTVDSGGGGADGGVTVDSGGGVTDGGVTVDSGGGGTDGGVTVDSGVTPPADGGAGVIDCMGLSCNAATEQCCVSGGGIGTPPTPSCIPAGDMCMGATVDCDAPNDCGRGEVCCARIGLGGVAVACEDPADGCGAGGFGSFELCNAAADCTDAADMCCPFERGGFSASICSARCFGMTP